VKVTVFIALLFVAGRTHAADCASPLLDAHIDGIRTFVGGYLPGLSWTSRDGGGLCGMDEGALERRGSGPEEGRLHRRQERYPRRSRPETPAFRGG